MTNLATKTIPVEDMIVSHLNMRHGRKAPNVDDIYPSIREKGILQPLLVRREKDRWAGVAGRRRLFSLRRKAKELKNPQQAQCVILKEGDDAAAIEASLLENVARRPANEFQEYDAYSRLAKKGRKVADIADIFGVTPLKVKKIMTLAKLEKDIRKLYEADEINVGTLRALTLATRDQQLEWLALYNGDEYAPRGERIKDWLTGGGEIQTDAALFALEDYEGSILTDLFDEKSIFQDTGLFWDYQHREIQARISAYKEQGWPDIVLLEKGKQFSDWMYVKRGKTRGGKVFVEIRHDGHVAFHEGFLTNEDHKKIEAILKSAPEEKSATTTEKKQKPEMSKPLCEYVALHRHAATRATLLEQILINLVRILRRRSSFCIPAVRTDRWLLQLFSTVCQSIAGRVFSGKP